MHEIMKQLNMNLHNDNTSYYKRPDRYRQTDKCNSRKPDYKWRIWPNSHICKSGRIKSIKRIKRKHIGIDANYF